MSSCGYKGFTLLDTMIVVSIMATFAVMALPSFTSNDSYQLDLAKAEIVTAIRFARSEALRSGETYGVDIDRASKQITVYKADLNTTPVGQESIAYHPINKNSYNYNLDTDFNLVNIDIINATDPFLFTDSVRRKSLLFDKNGIPIWFNSNTGTTYQLSSATIKLVNGNHERDVFVHPYNGRVTVQ